MRDIRPGTVDRHQRQSAHLNLMRYRAAQASRSRGHSGATGMLRPRPNRAEIGPRKILHGLGKAFNAIDKAAAIPGFSDDTFEPSSKNVKRIRARNAAIERTVKNPLRDPAATAALASMFLPGRLGRLRVGKAGGELGGHRGRVSGGVLPFGGRGGGLYGRLEGREPSLFGRRGYWVDAAHRQRWADEVGEATVRRWEKAHLEQVAENRAHPVRAVRAGTRNRVGEMLRNDESAIRTAGKLVGGMVGGSVIFGGPVILNAWREGELHRPGHYDPTHRTKLEESGQKYLERQRVALDRYQARLRQLQRMGKLSREEYSDFSTAAGSATLGQLQAASAAIDRKYDLVRRNRKP